LHYLISGEQESPGVRNDVSKYSAEYFCGVRCAGGAAAPGSSAVNDGDDDAHSEGHREVEASS